MQFHSRCSSANIFYAIHIAFGSTDLNNSFLYYSQLFLFLPLSFFKLQLIFNGFRTVLDMSSKSINRDQYIESTKERGFSVLASISVGKLKMQPLRANVCYIWYAEGEKHKLANLFIIPHIPRLINAQREKDRVRKACENCNSLLTVLGCSNFRSLSSLWACTYAIHTFVAEVFAFIDVTTVSPHEMTIRRVQSSQNHYWIIAFRNRNQFNPDTEKQHSRVGEWTRSKCIYRR